MNKISVVIPCYNEWARLVVLVDHVFSLFHHEVQIIICDQSQDQIIVHSLEKYKDNQNLIYTRSPWNCRAETMNHGAQFATGDILLFLHADTQLSNGIVQELECLDIAHYCAWWFLKFYSPYGFWTSVMTTIRNERRKRSKLFFGDNAMRCVRKVFEELGWYAKMKLFEDVEFSTRIRDYAEKNDKAIFVSSIPVITSARKYIQQWFWHTLYLQTKLQIKYKLGLYSDDFEKQYYEN